MPALMIRLSDAEDAAYRKAAALASLPVSSWARSRLTDLAREHLPAGAPMAVPPKPSKPYVKPGPKQIDIDEYLDLFARRPPATGPVDRFPSGQRRYRRLVDKFSDYGGGRYADDERAHAALERDLRAWHPAMTWCKLTPRMREYAGMPKDDNIERSIPEE